MFPYGNIGGLQQKNSKIKKFCKIFFLLFIQNYKQDASWYMPQHTHAFSRNSYFYLKLAFFFWFSRSENLFDPPLHHLYVLSL